MNRSIQDEKLIETIFQTDFQKHKTLNLILDARPTANAMAQTALGAGTENTDNYAGTRLVFLGIENIHSVRDSMNKMLEQKKNADINGFTELALDKTGWLRHVKSIIDGAAIIVNAIHNEQKHVLVHCRYFPLSTYTFLIQVMDGTEQHSYVQLLKFAWILTSELLRALLY